MTNHPIQFPRWRSDLKVIQTSDADGRCVHVEDSLRHKFFRIGATEYALLSRCDGQLSFDEVLRLTNQCLNGEGFSESEAQAVLKWASQQALVARENDGTSSAADSQTVLSVQRRWNLLSIRVPLGSPDRWCERWLPRLGWLYSTSAFVAWWVLISVALTDVLLDWPRFVAATSNILVPENWLGLGLAWLVLKVVHEAAHGLACKRHGGDVREAGFALILFAPVAYVDVTSCWRFPSRWQRIQTAAAGMFAETALAAIAILLAGWVQSREWQHFLDNVAVMAGVTTLLFNVNPLSRFDGYFILADWLQMPNLFARARQAVRRRADGLFFGAALDTDVPSIWLAAYGLATWLWSAAVICGLIVAASWYWHGAGLILSALIAVTWLTSMTRGWREAWRRFLNLPRCQRLRASWRLSGLAVVIVGVLWLPWPFATRAPGVIDFEPLSVLRAESPGFVARVLVQDGERVVAGQSLIELHNDDLLRERDDLELAIAQARAREDLANEQRDAAGVQVEQQQRAALMQRLSERQRQVEHLAVRAPFDGVVIGPQLAALHGSFVKAGRELLSVGDPSRRQFVAMVSQEHMSSAQSRLSQPIGVRLQGRGPVSGRLDRVSPRASVVPDQLCLCAPFGGPLPVQTLPNESQQRESTTPRFELLQPHFRVIVTLDQPAGQQMLAGELGWVSFGHDRTCGAELWSAVARWLHQRRPTDS